MTDEVREKESTYSLEEDMEWNDIPSNHSNHTNHTKTNKKNYTKEEIEEIIEEKLYETCSTLIAYVRQYSYEKGIPLGDRMDYSSLYQFLTETS